MKTLIKFFYLALIIVLYQSNILSSSNPKNITPNTNQDVIIQQVEFLSPDIRTWVYNTGILNQDLRISNTPGFEWPINSGKFAIFTSGICISAFVNGILTQAMCSYNGEYAPGHIEIIGGIPVALTNNTFKVYKVKAGDNYQNNPDWANWGLMIPFGAPYTDVNNNNVFDPQIDSPGVKGAYQTLFACLTDGFPEEHKIGEGFGGGTLPLYAEMHLTAWSYNAPGYNNMQFIKWDLINKNIIPWDSVYFSIVADPDLGNGDDDYIGCDTIRKLGYCYNASNMDGNGSGRTYGLNPPAVGIRWLGGSNNQPTSLNSLTYFTNNSAGPPPCESDPNGEPVPAYYMMKGLKKDQTPWVIPNTNPPQTTKFCYSGNPEDSTGWTEYVGQIQNCGGLLTGQYVHPTVPGDRRFVMSKCTNTNSLNPSDTVEIVIAQLISRGSNNKNSVTLLKQLSDAAYELYNSGFVIGIEPVSNIVPGTFSLNQNYPNPFNPTTKIKFDIPKSGNAKLVVYDILGREVTTLVNDQLKAGSYEVEWNARNYASGIYFYTLSTESFNQTKRMVLVK